jgi:hypothetical protein
MGRLYRGRYRRLLTPRYPFGIFYVVESNRIVIHAVPDLRQDPEKIRSAFPTERIFDFDRGIDHWTFGSADYFRLEPVG